MASKHQHSVKSILRQPANTRRSKLVESIPFCSYLLPIQLSCHKLQNLRRSIAERVLVFSFRQTLIRALQCDSACLMALTGQVVLKAQTSRTETTLKSVGQKATTKSRSAFEPNDRRRSQSDSGPYGRFRCRMTSLSSSFCVRQPVGAH